MGNQEDDFDALGIALRVARAIETVGGAYFVGGSLASSRRRRGSPGERRFDGLWISDDVGATPRHLATLRASVRREWAMTIGGPSTGIGRGPGRSRGS